MCLTARHIQSVFILLVRGRSFQGPNVSTQTRLVVNTSLVNTGPPPSRFKVSCPLDGWSRTPLVPVGPVGPSTVVSPQRVDARDGHIGRESPIPLTLTSRRRLQPLLLSGPEGRVPDEDDYQDRTSGDDNDGERRRRWWWYRLKR